MVGATVSADLPLSQSLMQLQEAADRIFKAISKRVGSEHQQLKMLSDRIVTAQAKVDAISGTKRATTIYSSAKFPRVDPSVADFVPLFEGTGIRQVKSCADTVSLNTGLWQSQEEGTLELFQFFSETSHEYWLKDHKRKDGVGKVPPRIKSVADVLLFNSTEFPYHKYRVVDNLAGVDQLTDQEELEVKPAALPAAPQSILAGDVLPRPGGEEFGFRPVMRQVPSFSLPSVLPDLPMIAEISWSGVVGGTDQLPSIAPSAIHGGAFSPRSNYSASPRFDSASTSSRFDPGPLSTRLDFAAENGSIQNEKKASSRPLPRLNVRATPLESTGQSNSAISRSNSGDSTSGSNLLSSSLVPQSSPVDSSKVRTPPPPPPRSTVDAPPLPPKPPAPPTPPALPTLHTPPPLPPPPPPSLHSSNSNVSQIGNDSSAQQTLPPIDSQRAALMASIRQSGLSLLRKTGRKEGTKVFPETTGRTEIGRADAEVSEKIISSDMKQPVNVMAEMSKSLTLRRLSMRGASHTKGANDGQEAPRDGGLQIIASGQSSTLSLPNLNADIPEDDEQSDDDDWE